MRKVEFSLIILSLALFCFITSAVANGPWFDMENCAFCKNLTAEPGLMDHFKKWEHHNVHNGSISISIVDEEYTDAYKRAMHKMQEVNEKLKQGEQLPMCGMCIAYGDAMMKGAKLEAIESGNVFITLMYSDNPEVVKEIHTMTNRTNDEMKKMEEAEKLEKK